MNINHCYAKTSKTAQPLLKKRQRTHHKLFGPETLFGYHAILNLLNKLM